MPTWIPVLCLLLNRFDEVIITETASYFWNIIHLLRSGCCDIFIATFTLNLQKILNDFRNAISQEIIISGLNAGFISCSKIFLGN